jgi:hypothetical protein
MGNSPAGCVSRITAKRAITKIALSISTSGVKTPGYFLSSLPGLFFPPCDKPRVRLQNKKECGTTQSDPNNTTKNHRVFMPTKQKTDWHRLLGLIFTDFFTGSAWNVELEKDLSMKRQLLDIIILRHDGGGLIDPLPDGLEGMKKHNLLTFKSIREPLDDWVLKELTGHYVNYRKQISPSFNDLYPEEQFQLYGITARYPKKGYQLKPGQKSRSLGLQIRQMSRYERSTQVPCFTAVPP